MRPEVEAKCRLGARDGLDVDFLPFSPRGITALDMDSLPLIVREVGQLGVKSRNDTMPMSVAITSGLLDHLRKNSGWTA